MRSWRRILLRNRKRLSRNIFMEKSLRSDQADRLRKEIKNKLLECGLLEDEEVKNTLALWQQDGLEYIEDVTEYVVTLVCANMRPEEITRELRFFLRQRGAQIMAWLWDDHIASHINFYSTDTMSRATQYEAQSSNTTSRATQYEAQSSNTTSRSTQYEAPPPNTTPTTTSRSTQYEAESPNTSPTATARSTSSPSLVYPTGDEYSDSDIIWE